IHGSRCLAIFAVNSDGGDFALGDNNISVHDNVCDDIDTKWSTTTGACCFWASSFQVQNQYAAPNNLHDISFVHNTALSFQSFATIQFTNLNAANGGNYLLLNTSPGHLAGHDGKDLGADINLLNQYTSGVQ